jgi:hypothetical protein
MGTKMYDAEEILEEIFHDLDLTEEQKEKVKDSVEKITETINKDVKLMTMRPYSHNIIGLCLSSIAKATSYRVANECISRMSMIHLSYGIQPAAEE